LGETWESKLDEVLGLDEVSVSLLAKVLVMVSLLVQVLVTDET